MGHRYHGNAHAFQLIGHYCGKMSLWGRLKGAGIENILKGGCSGTTITAIRPHSKAHSGLLDGTDRENMKSLLTCCLLLGV